MKLTTYLHIVPRLRMSKAIPSVFHIFVAFTGTTLHLTHRSNDSTDIFYKKLNVVKVWNLPVVEQLKSLQSIFTMELIELISKILHFL
jgi:hypothetical protein